MSPWNPTISQNHMSGCGSGPRSMWMQLLRDYGTSMEGNQGAGARLEHLDRRVDQGCSTRALQRGQHSERSACLISGQFHPSKLHVLGTSRPSVAPSLQRRNNCILQPSLPRRACKVSRHSAISEQNILITSSISSRTPVSFRDVALRHLLPRPLLCR